MTDMNQDILIQLDALLDTHLGVACLIDPSWPMKLLDNGYQQRRNNDLTHVCPEYPQAQHNVLYERRDHQTLMRSAPTELCFNLKTYLEMVMSMSESDPRVSFPRVHINTAPYKFTDEQKAALVESLVYHWGDHYQIQTLHVDIEWLTPEYLWHRYISVIMPDLDAWMTLHFESLDKRPIPATLLLAPRLYGANIDFDKAPNNELNIIHDMIPMTLGTLVGVQWLPVSAFSLFQWDGLDD